MRLLHYIDLGVVGGVEHQFSQFLNYTRTHNGIDHAVIASGPLHPQLRADIYRDAKVVEIEKSRWSIKLPKQPSVIRSCHQKEIIRRANPDLALLWNKGIGKSKIARQIGPGKCIFWDRGASWGTGPAGGKRAILLPGIRSVLSPCRASQRMLQLHWQYDGDIAVCHNGLRPNMVPAQPKAKQYPTSRTFKIGVASRLEPQKGVNLTIHTLRELRRQGLNAELHIAGSGSQKTELQRVTEQLDLETHVNFINHVRDMRTFYESVDCLLHLPICEPFAGAIIEALAYGCPVITNNADGAPEIVDHDRTGKLVSPTLSIADYCKLGGSSKGLPPYVYAPTSDTVEPPSAVDPADAASAVIRLLGDEDIYCRTSAAASEDAIRRFAYANRIASVMDALAQFVETGSVIK